MPSIRHKRGLKANLPSAGLSVGELYLTTDRRTIHFPVDATTMVGAVPAIDDLTVIGSINGAADLLMIHDADGVGVKEKRVTFNDFKAALAIPPASTDERAAVVSGGTPGFIWGTDGTDGILRMNTSLSWTKDSGNAFVTLAVNNVDCGTF
jgi:hypothetical protein